jgi:periplasmic divalent cation tolerance protein
MSLAIAYIPCPSRAVARAMARRLVAKRLIACANIFQAESLYRWKGKIAEEKEYILLCKTVKGKFPALRREVERIHPYSIPCILKIEADANEKYSDWAASEMAGK